MMRGLFGVLLALAATALLESPASAHHSQAMFDTNREVLFEGTVVRFDWVNPHMYLYVEAEGPDGETAVIQGEGLAITQALVDGLDRDALQPGMPVIVRANPNRGGWGKQVRVLDEVGKEDALAVAVGEGAIDAGAVERGVDVEAVADVADEEEGRWLVEVGGIAEGLAVSRNDSKTRLHSRPNCG